jgi:Fe-S-cluster containining protein|uniref:YkgJ family cysteine cluster protein n=1 Tax=Desulfobacca acetoxidans TaxID=60893 RepID=A0A7V6A2C6_9BACT
MQDINKRPVFSCRQCGECCRGERGILVAPVEQAAMAEYLGLDPGDFAARYLIATPLGPQLASRNGACVMQEANLCLVHPVKPRICREWPYLPALLNHADEFAAAKEACPGLAVDAGHQEFVEEAQEIRR